MNGVTSFLWALSSSGNVYKLPQGERKWQHVSNQQGPGLRGFKKIIALPDGVVGLGCDHQVYVMVPKSEISIRQQVSTCENERWIPIKGWSHKHLLPIDPPAWSTESGSRSQPKESVKLLSDNWTWEADWYVDENVDGFMTDKGGWQYANVNFGEKFSHRKTIKSCVRRRKWIRNMVYSATGQWARLPSLHLDPLKEPIIDVDVGGHLLPNAPKGFMAVWAVTIDGAVYFRTGMESERPEGTSWERLEDENGEEMLNVSVAANSQVWGVTWSGRLLARTGITWRTPTGDGWILIGAPEEKVHLSHIALGDHCAWAVSKDGHVFYRKGVCSSKLASDPHAATGISWLPMVHRMKTVVIGPDDQVWAIDEQQQICFRSGISKDEPAGKVWRRINPKPELDEDSDADSMSSGVSTLRSIASNLDELDKPTQNSSGVSSGASTGQVDFVNAITDGSGTDSSQNIKYVTDGETIQNPEEANIQVNSTSKVDLHVGTQTQPDESVSEVCCEQVTAKFTKSTGDFAVSFKKSNTFSNATDMGISTSASINSLNKECYTGLNDDFSSLSMRSWYSDVEVNLDEEPTEGDTLYWVGVGPGVCKFHKESDLQDWFTSDSGNSTHRNLIKKLRHAPWRPRVMELLRYRNAKQHMPFADFILAVDKIPALSVKEGKLKWWQDTVRKPRWVDCDIRLVTECAEEGRLTGMLSLEYKKKKTKCSLVIPLEDVVCVHCGTSDISHPEIFVETQERLEAAQRKAPLKLRTNGEDGLVDWLSAINIACVDIHRVTRGTGSNKLWSLSGKGDVFSCQIHDGAVSPHKGFWYQEGGHMRKVESCTYGVTWAISYDNTVYAHSGGYGGAIYTGLACSSYGVHSQTDIRTVVIYEYQRWKILSGYSDRGLPLDGPMWKDESGKQCTKDDIKLLSRNHTWISEWTVDHRTPGKVDKDGWQYGRHFWGSFHGEKGLQDFVRRRKWIRQFQVKTSGPWEEVPSFKAVDISLLSGLKEETAQPISCWAIGTNGDALCRIGVTQQEPRGKEWGHAVADTKFVAISIGWVEDCIRVWAAAADGACWLRLGVHHQNPLGDSWLHIPPPSAMSRIVQLSATSSCLYARDHKKVFWTRRGICKTTPDGTAWEQKGVLVDQVSAGHADEAWCILDRMPSAHGFIDGVVCRCPQLTHSKLNRSSVEPKLGPGWVHVTARGLTKEKKCI